MDEIKSWAFSVCAASICGAVLNIILPEGSTQKIFKTVFCVFFLCCLVSPLLKTDLFDNSEFLDTPKSEYEEESFEKSIYESSSKAIQNEITAKTEDILRKNGVSFTDVSISINILENGGIEINDFSISAASDISEEVKEQIGNETGLIPKVKISGESF